MAFMRSPVRSRSGPPSFAHECRRRMPRRSVAKRREGGLVLSMNELRLGKPVASIVAAVTCSAIAQTAIVAVPSAHIPRLSKHHGLALALPSPAHAGRQAIRLRSEECRCEATLLRRLHL